MRLPPKDKVIRIDCIERPISPDGKNDSGIFEWAYMSDRFKLNLPLLKDHIAELGGVWPSRVDSITDRLMNFRRIYLILDTTEVISGSIPQFKAW